MAYITPATFIKLYDDRVIRQNLSDTGVPVVGSLDNNDNLLEALSMASEVVSAAAMVGARYTPEQLQSLADSTTTGFLLRRIVADIAMGLIMARRVRSVSDLEKITPLKAWAEQQLDLLRTGTHLFPGTEAVTAPAGLPAQANLISNSNPRRYNSFTMIAARVFPFSCQRMPNGNCNCN